MLRVLWGCVVLVSIAAGLGSVSCLAGARVAGRSPAAVRWTATASLFAWLLTVVFHSLASLRAFTPLAAALSAATLGAIATVPRWEQCRRLVRLDRELFRRLRARIATSRHRPVALALTLCALPIVLRTLVLPPLGWDALTYHGVKAATWVQHGRVDGMNGPGTWAYYQHMFGGGEVMAAWAMLPFHADTLVPLLDLAGWIGTGFGVLVLARELGAREPYASTSAAFVLAVPTLRLMPGSLYVEPPMLAALSAGLALAVAAVTRRRPALLFPAAAALGVAASTKLPMLVATAVPLFVAATQLQGAWSRRLVWMAASAAAYAAGVGPWLLRAWLETGAPLSPLPVVVAGWTLGVAPPELQWYMALPQTLAVQIPSELEILGKIFASPESGVEGLGVLTAATVPAIVAGAVHLARRAPRSFAVVMAAFASCVGAYYAPSFSVVRHVFPVNSSRFLLPAVLVGVTISVVWCQPGSRLAGAYRRLLLAATFWHLLSYVWVGSTELSRAGALKVGVIAALLGETWHLLGSVRMDTFRMAARAAMLVAGLALLFSWREAHRYALMEDDYTLHPFGTAHYWPRAAAQLDTPDAPRRIAVTAGPDQRLDNWFVYPFMGRRLQNEVMYVPLASDGRVHHFGDPAENSRYAEGADYEIWRGRLMLRGVTDVVSFLPTSIELTWMEQHPEHFQRIAGLRSNWGAFHVTGR